MIAVKPSDSFSVTVHGFEIKSNSIYQVIPKPDEDAPDGFRKERTTKILSPRIGEIVGCVKNAQTNTWDTGFYIYSPCYKNLPMDDREEIASNVVKNIKEPIENLYGGTERLDQNNDEFWDDYSFELKNGGIFNTSDPKDLLNLYMAVLHRALAPKKDASESAYREAKYCVVNKDEVIDRKLQKDLNYNKAVGSFWVLLENNKSKLLNVLSYLGLQADEKTSEATLSNVVTNFLQHKQNGDQNVDIFLDAFAKAKTTEGYKEISLFKELKDLAKKGIVTKEAGSYMLAGKTLGATFKIAASVVANDQSLQEAVITALD